MAQKISPAKLALFYGTKPTWYKINLLSEYQTQLLEIEEELAQKYKQLYTDYILKYARGGRRLKIKAKKNSKAIQKLVYADNNSH